MRINQIPKKLNLAINIGLILTIVFFIPLILNFVDPNLKIQILSSLGNFCIILLIIITIIDLFYLIVKKQNVILFFSLNMSLSISVFLLLEYCFLFDFYDFIYVWSYSESTLPILYKSVAIWAGEAGSIMTWMVFNSIIIAFYRLKNQKSEDIVFIRSVVLSLMISIVFLGILLFLNVFKVETPSIYPNGLGLNPLLISPYMLWHPLFTFIAYSIFLIPFSIVIAEIITPKIRLQNTYQKAYFNFALKLGWMVLTLSIGLGAFWAKITVNWGRYWGWDPVETVSLVPWLFCTAYFHTRSFGKKNKNIVKINVLLIFFSILFATFITRGGGLNSLHAFTGKQELIVLVVLIGSLLILLSLYIIYDILNELTENYRKTKLFFDYLSYLFLFLLAFFFIFGLIMPPLTYILSSYININAIFIGTNYYIFGFFGLTFGVAISLIFCSLWEYYTLKSIITFILIALVGQIILSFIILISLDMWISPLLIINVLALIAPLFKIIKGTKKTMSLKKFFRVNSKSIIHVGISCVLIGTVIDPNMIIFQDIFYTSGFIILLCGIIPSIVMILITYKASSNNNTENNIAVK